MVAALALPLVGGVQIDPIADAKLIERVAELALVVAVFTTGLKIERRLRWSEWRSVARLILIAMPATIVLVALFGTQVMGLSLGAAILLGAILAPTDPVLAGDVGVGPPASSATRSRASRSRPKRGSMTAWLRRSSCSASSSPPRAARGG